MRTTILLLLSGLLLGPLPLRGQASVLYGSDLTPDALGSIDRNTAVFTVIGPHGGTTNMTGLAWDSLTDTLYAVSPNGDSLYTIDQATGASTLVGPTGFSNVNALAHDPSSNTLYSADLNGNNLFTVNPATGAGTLIAGINGATAIEGLGFDPVNNILYGLDDGQIPERIVTIDRTTGVATPLPMSLPVSGLWRGLDYDTELNVLWATTVNPGRLFRVDPATGVATQIMGPLPSFIQGVGFKGAGPTGPLYQVNQLEALIDINGIVGSPASFAQVNLGLGQVGTATLTSILTGASWELAIGMAPLVPANQGGLTTSDGQILNIDLGDPALMLLWGGFQSPPFTNLTGPIPSNAAVAASFQMGVLDASAASGIRLSQPVRLIIQ